MQSYLIFFIIFGSILLAVIAVAIASYIIIFRQRILKHKMELDAIEAQRANELLQAKVRAHEQALQFVSWELHDNVCQVLGMSGTLLLDSVEMAEKKTKEQLVVEMGDTAQRLIATTKDLKNIASTLNSNKIEEIGLVKFIEKEASFIRSLHSRKLECVFHHDERLPPLHSGEVLLTGRIIQEAIMNIIRHAQASMVTITLKVTGNKLKLSIEDNGNGFDLSQKAGEKMGLLNMRERAQLLGAELDITSVLGKGTSVNLVLNTNNNTYGTDNY